MIHIRWNYLVSRKLTNIASLSFWMLKGASSHGMQLVLGSMQLLAFFNSRIRTFSLQLSLHQHPPSSWSSLLLLCGCSIFGRKSVAFGDTKLFNALHERKLFNWMVLMFLLKKWQLGSRPIILLLKKYIYLSDNVMYIGFWSCLYCKEPQVSYCRNLPWV